MSKHDPLTSSKPKAELSTQESTVSEMKTKDKGEGVPEGAGPELFGTIALRSGLIQESDLTDALAKQKAQSQGEKSGLGDILVEMGVLKQVDVTHILDVQVLLQEPDEETRFGLAALRNNLVSEEDLERCLQIQGDSGTGTFLGEVMVQEGVLTEQQRDALLMLQQRAKEIEKQPLSPLVETIRRGVSEGEEVEKIIAPSVKKSKLSQAEELIKSSVMSMTHLGILSHINPRIAKNYSTGEFVEALGESVSDIKSALEDLVGAGLIIREGLISRKYRYTDNQDSRMQIENLKALAANPKTRRKVYEILLRA